VTGSLTAPGHALVAQGEDEGDAVTRSEECVARALLVAKCVMLGHLTTWAWKCARERVCLAELRGYRTFIINIIKSTTTIDNLPAV